MQEVREIPDNESALGDLRYSSLLASDRASTSTQQSSPRRPSQTTPISPGQALLTTTSGYPAGISTAPFSWRTRPIKKGRVLNSRSG